MTGEHDDPVPIRNALSRIGAELGMPAPGALSALERQWTDIVGAEMARHVQPAGVRDGVLTVVVEDAAWATQLRYLEADLVRAATTVVGPDVVLRLRVRVARETAGPPGKTGPSLVE
jgi:predicted nucleic acid-binding Zn ribbon protein